MTARRLDQSFSRNSKCPCGSGKKVKKCCTQLLQSITNYDVKQDECQKNSEASRYIRTTESLQRLEAPVEGSIYKAKMTCGGCSGRGDRPKSKRIIGRPLPERTTCESCGGEGWYWVEVSEPIKLEHHDQSSIITYKCDGRCNQTHEFFNLTGRKAPSSMQHSSIAGCDGTLVKQSSHGFFPEFTVIEDDSPFSFIPKATDYLMELYPGTISVLTKQQLVFACIYGCIYSNISDQWQHNLAITRSVRQWAADNNYTVEPPRKMIDSETEWWHTNNRYFIPVIDNPTIAKLAWAHEVPGTIDRKKQYDEIPLVYVNCGDGTYYIRKYQACHMGQTVTEEHFDSLKLHLCTSLKMKYKEYEIPLD